jgi:hypothetical protein
MVSFFPAVGGEFVPVAGNAIKELNMKKARAILCAGGMFLAILAGCANPTTAVLSEAENQEAGNSRTASGGFYPGEEGPLMLHIGVEGGGMDRSVAGLTKDRTQLAGNGTRNYIQVIVVDAETNEVVEFKEDRQVSSAQASAKFSLTTLDWATPKKYHFLALAGHWQRNYGSETPGGPYAYSNELPTLFLAGFVRDKEPESEITIPMMPIFVDTAFTTTGPLMGTGGTKDYATIEPAMTEALGWKPQEAALLPVSWTAKWTLKGTGLLYLLGAQNRVSGSVPLSTSLSGAVVSSVVRGPLNGSMITATLPSTQSSTGTVFTDNNTLDEIFGVPGGSKVTAFTIGNDVVSMDLTAGLIGTGMGAIGKKGNAYFKLEYVPFGTATLWDNKTSAVFTSHNNLNGGKPKWIIRNGVNDIAQNDATVFDGVMDYTVPTNTIPGTTWTGTSDTTPNGNGAVRFAIRTANEDPYFPGYTAETLVITAGEYTANADPTSGGTVTFDAGGWTGDATAYWISRDTEPPLKDFTQQLGVYTAGAGRTGTISMYPDTKSIWLVLVKEWNFSNIFEIKTTNTVVKPEVKPDPFY